MLTRTMKLRWRRLLMPRGLAVLFWLALLALLMPLGGRDQLPPVPPPEQSATSRQVWLEQNWSEARSWFDPASQRRATLPVTDDGFMALDRAAPAHTPG